ncbi:MAG: hypothetical protein QOF02_3870 [Blastocatellia bacterium]|jgi:hypothetical protein|nr:hypothetical protein [Blastocatellia bacterium]
MKFKSLALICLLTPVCCLTAAAQETKCALKISQLVAAPELHGFRLGMTLAEFKARVPKLAIRPADEFGATAINIYPEHEENIDKASFEGVRTISLDFLDGRVVMLWVGYAPGFKWKTPDEFLSGMTRALALPAAWTTRPRGQQLACDDFQILISSIGGNPSIRFVDEAAHRTLEERKAAKEEAAEESKPR